MSGDIEFVDGLLVKPPHPKAPSFVKASISFKVEELVKWLEGKRGEEWVNIDVKESRGGKWYAAVSNFKAKEKAAPPKTAGRFGDLPD
jgi:hypothetical protein